MTQTEKVVDEKVASIEEAVQKKVLDEPVVLEGRKEETVELKKDFVVDLLLSSERLNSARTNLELRETQQQLVIQSLITEYSENGKYKVLSFNVDKRQVVRTLAS